MRPVLARLCAVLLLVGQLVQVSGGSLCGLQLRHRAMPCEGAMQPLTGASLTAAGDHGAGPCDAAGPCSAPAPALTTASAAGLVFVVATASHPATLPGPASFSAAPTPPPPQA